MSGLLVLDGDILAYRCSAAIQKRMVEATHKDTLEVVTFDTATAFKEWAGAEKDDYTLVPKQESEPIEHALHAMKQTIARILEKSKCDKYHIVVSGDDNFRLQLPLPTRYKSVRDGSMKPEHLAECKEYLKRVHNAEVSSGNEADDVLVAYAYQGYRNKEYVVQATLDKDGYANSGWLFNWLTMEEPELIEGFGYIELVERPTYTDVKGRGRAFTWYQILFGDPADGYKPCELAKARFGDKGAYKLLKDAKTDKEALEVLVAQYKRWYAEPVTYRAWDGSLHTKDWLQIMQMYADCVHMQRWENDRLDIEKVLNKLGVNYK